MNGNLTGRLLCAGAMILAVPARAYADDLTVQQRASLAPDQVSCKASQGEPTIDEARDLTGLIGLHQCWLANESNDDYRNLNDLYTHWTLSRIDSPEQERPREYGAESVAPIVRMFISRDHSFVSSVRIDMHNPDATFTIPLASFSYDGKFGKGQSWTTEVVSDDQSQPWFRLQPNTTATISATARSSQDLEARSAGVILATIKSFAALVTPGGPLLTALNSADVSAASAKVDDALKNLWSKSLDEKQVSGRVMSEWYENGSFVIEVVVPDFVRTSDNLHDRTVPTRRWYRLSLSCPLYSIFWSRPACADAADRRAGKNEAATGYQNAAFFRHVSPMFDKVSPEEVINFTLATNKTLQGMLQEKPWYTNFLRQGEGKTTVVPAASAAILPPGAPGAAAPADALAPPPPAAAVLPDPPPRAADGPQPSATGTARSDQDYAGFCHAVVNALYGAGLSAFDARLGLWAIVYGSIDFVGMHQDFESNADCLNLLPGGPTGKWQFAYRAAGAGISPGSAHVRRSRRGAPHQ